MLCETIPLVDADLTFYQKVWTPKESQRIYLLLQTLHWQQKNIRLFGREVMQPRLVAWYGDAGADYVYSGVRNIPLPWPACLVEIRQRVQQLVQSEFNSVLCNLYRNGDDSVGWHSDDEAELGPEPMIASVSFGATRRFSLQHKRDKTVKGHLDLPDASLLLMKGATQQNYRHAVLKAKTESAPRINLTFRKIIIKK